ncbi:DUF2262 domain-containing protein [Thalassoglobus sp. JC818]|uniref:DUF2262 domain-containing protein n=1 Tax=Thalassoglobus sp. JC818 TaxID=3232136 RepID=UPI00345ADE39
MKDAVEWEKQLHEDLRKQPVTEITGILKSDGFRAADCGKQDGSHRWKMTMTFIAWRIGDGPIRTDNTLYFRRSGDEADARALAKAMTQGTLQITRDDPDFVCVRMPADSPSREIILRVQGRPILEGYLSIMDTPCSPNAWYEAFIEEVTDDSEMQSVLVDLQNPVTLDHKKLGKFTLERNLGWFTSATKFQRSKINLRLEAKTVEEAEKAVINAEKLFKSAANWNKTVRQLAADQLLETKNEDWLDDDESPVNARTFKSRLSVNSIVVSPDGYVTFWLDDGDLFWGHSLEVSGTLADGPTRVEIQG